MPHCMLGYTPTPEYTGYGQQAGGTHPTGMHTCMHTCSHCNEKGNNSDFFWGVVPIVIDFGLSLCVDISVNTP